MLLEPALALPQPAPTPLHAGHDLGRIKLERHLRGCLRLGLLARPRVLLLAQSLPGLAEELAPARGSAQPLGQLIARASP